MVWNAAYLLAATCLVVGVTIKSLFVPALSAKQEGSKKDRKVTDH
jgi:hypothetical protein